MANQSNRIRRLLVTSTIIAFAIVSAGCSYVISFNLRNLSGRTITVNYAVKNINNGFAPMLVQKNAVKNVSSVPFPDDRLSIDVENGTVEFKLFDGEEVEVDHVSDSRESDYEQKFNLKSLRITGEEGSILLEGREAFKSFRQINKSWYDFGPETIGFEFEYK